VKVKVVHRECGREVLVQQVLDNRGHCPWDGRPFSPHYTAVLVEALGAAEVAGNALENALERMAGMAPDLSIDRDSVLGPLEAAIDHLNRERRTVPR
jgi:hypothetical protein